MPDAEIVVLMDRSGSMDTIKTDMEGGFKSFIEDQKKEKGKCTVTVVQFDDTAIETVIDQKSIQDVSGVELEPRGATPLLDAMGRTIADTKKRLKSFKGNVIFLVITDGYENSSKEYTKEKVKALVDEQTKSGWGFLYLAANVDAFDEAGKVGVMTSNAMGYKPTGGGVKHMYNVASANVSNMRSATPTSLKVANIAPEDHMAEDTIKE